ncbi:MAG: HAMP domain-containing protein [Kofleriaceae bacterium]|nr:HAMP domain-containing protein [Kofleriaceae bacterium]
MRIRLRSRLVFAMALAALLPVLVVAVVATQAIFSSLERGLRSDADRQLSVATNLLLRQLERLGDEAAQIANSSDLPLAMRHGGRELDGWLAHATKEMPSAVLQIFDTQGVQQARALIGGSPERFAGVALPDRDPMVLDAQGWVRQVSMTASASVTMVRAAAPVLDGGFGLRGSIVMSVPLDGQFADALKGALGVEVLLAAPDRPALSTLRNADGQRDPPMELATAVRDRLARGQRATGSYASHGDEFVIAWSPLRDREAWVGVIGIALNRSSLARTKAVALRALLVGVVVAIGVAFALALWWARRLNAPLIKLHRGAIAVSRGDLNHRIEIPAGDEIGDLATAFNHMTQTLLDNQGRLAARMREIVALHDAGRAVSSVLDPDQVPRKVVEALARTFDVRLVGLWLLQPDGQLDLKAARGQRGERSFALAADDALLRAADYAPLATTAASQGVLRYENGQNQLHPGPVVAMPLERKGRIIGVVVIARAQDGRGFSEADLSLLATFADQASAAIDNGMLYQQVRGASAELERKVQLRTLELTAMNTELGRTLCDLRDTQAQLILSERLAGLGMLVAGVAHEINSPSAAIRGSVQSLGDATGRVAERLLAVGQLALSAQQRLAIASCIRSRVPTLAARRMLSGVAARVVAKEIREQVRVRLGPSADDAVVGVIARDLADAAMQEEDVAAFFELAGPVPLATAPLLAETIVDAVYLHRTASTIADAIRRIARIVGALKSYSHLDQHAARLPADLHDGLESTLALFDYQLRDIDVVRDFADLPAVPVFVDELNQVWTNLLQNATQAIVASRPQPGARGRITLSTRRDGEFVVIGIADDGPGIEPAVKAQMFEPFFTTKAKGEGTGLGLGIVRQIVQKHGGEISCESQPGATQFWVRLPLEPASAKDATG